LPPNLERAILCCLEKNPDRRFASVNELDAALSGGDGAPVVSLGPAAVVAAAPTTEIAPPPQVLPGAVAPPKKRQWWKTAIGITAMGCAVPTLLVCLMTLAIVFRSEKRKMVPTLQVSPDGNVTVNPLAAPPKKPRKDRNAKSAPASDEEDETATPAPAISVPGVTIPNIPGIGKDGINIQEIVKNAQQMKIQSWVAQGDKFMQQKKYQSAVEVYQLAASASSDDAT